jgi:hypothetical protein
MIVEMRTYKTKPGKRSEFLAIFRSRSIPAHAEIGMRILGPFLSVEDPDTFFFMRGFPDIASREPMKAQFYEGKLWKDELEKVLMPMLEKYEVVVVEDSENLLKWGLPVAENFDQKHVDNDAHGGSRQAGDEFRESRAHEFKAQQ